MRAFAEFLVLEDDPQNLERIHAAMTRAGPQVLCASGPGDALARLHGRQPVLAVINLDVTEPEHTVGDVLSALASCARTCMVVVHSAQLGKQAHPRLCRPEHPNLLFELQRDGHIGLAKRIEAVLGAQFGDLSISRGRARHRPTGILYPHRIAVSLLMASHADQPLYLGESDARAARRFGRWLQDYVQSSVRVVKRRDGGYALGAAGNAEWASTGALNQRCRDTLSGGPVYGIR